MTVEQESDSADGFRNLCLKIFLTKKLCYILKKCGYIKCIQRSAENPHGVQSLNLT
jgi:hypothetical protein